MSDEKPASTETDASGFKPTREQELALTLGRNIAITAGAGTGKTTTLTHRYLELLRERPSITPENVVTITFTRKAAAELQTRVRNGVYDQLATATNEDDYERWRTVLDELDDGYTHTIHAFCTRLLRDNAIQAPVPVEFTVLDEDEAADLQRQVVIEYLDDHQDDKDVSLLTRLFGSHSRVVDVIAGLLDERPTSESWLEAWKDADVEEYMEYLWETICELEPETAQSFFDRPDVVEALETAATFSDRDFDVTFDASGIEVLRRVATAVEERNREIEVPGRADQQACRKLYDVLQTSSGGLYSSASYHLIGSKAAWNDETDAYSECKEALGTVLAELEPIESQLETTPGQLERNSAHYVFALARTFAHVSEAYAAEKRRQEVLDFPDLIETTVEFLETNPTVRTSLRESFDALMVDEFQDTDDHQWKLITLLADLMDDDTETDNVFLVGDKKQSIYGFRGADVTTFERAKRDLSRENERLGVNFLPEMDDTAPTDLELSGNFRTLEGPLTFLNEVFNTVFAAAGEEFNEFEAEPQPLSFERDRIDNVDRLQGMVEYLVVPEKHDDAAQLLGESHPVTTAAQEHSMAGEAEALAMKLQALFTDPPEVHDEETGEIRKATPEDVAILMRRRTHLSRYQRALEQRDIPYSVVSGIGFYDTTEVQTLINLLRVLADPTDDISLYGVLRSPLFGFTDDRLAELGASEGSIWEAVLTTEDTQLTDAAALLTKWRKLAGCVQSEETEVIPWNRVLTRVFDDTGYLVSIGADEGGQQAVANVEKFRDEVRQWSEGGVRTAASLLRRIDRQAELDPREGQAEIPSGTEGIRIMTIHAAKGLEFPIVVVPDNGSTLNFGRSIDGYGYVRLISDHDDDPFLAVSGPSPEDPFAVEQTTAHSYADGVERPRERAEAKRLLYVACTRTRDHLLLCGTHNFSEVSDGLALEPVAEAGEERRWRDWLQPLLLEDEATLQELQTRGRSDCSLETASYTVSIPPNEPKSESMDQSSMASESAGAPTIDIPDVPSFHEQRRVSATQLVEAASEYESDAENGDEDTTVQRSSRDSTTTDLPRNDFGTVVHRLLELDRPREEWPAMVRRIAGVNGFTITEPTLEEVLEHANDAKEFLTSEEARYGASETYEEVSVAVDVGDLRVVGDIDHLRVTDEAFIITDYKTNRIGRQTTESLAEHYRPQMMSYALSLLRFTPHRSVSAQLRFTDAQTTESFQWDSGDQDTLVAELTELGSQIAD